MAWRVVIENKTVLQCVEIHVCWCVCSFNLIYKNLERIVLETNKKLNSYTGTVSIILKSCSF